MRRLFYSIAIIITAGCLIAGAQARSPKSDITQSIDVFTTVIKGLEHNYVDTIDAEAVVRAGINEMLSTLDPYTEYIPRSEQADFKVISSGEYGGIGSYIMERKGNVYISGPYENSPAALAGLRWGDMIVRVDSTSTLGKSSSFVTERLKGIPGTTVHVDVKRPYVTDSMLSFDIVREKIWMPSVPYFGVLRGNIGYIQLSSFAEKTPQEVADALRVIMSDPEVKGLVLDLRDNGGGLLESAVKVLGYFLPKGTEVLRTRGRQKLSEKVYKTTEKPIAPDIPLVVLINSGSASSSEITAGALQDLDRAVIIGNRSFGKGLVQSTMQLPYDGMLKVTTAKYYIPSGRLIQAIDYSHRNADGSVARIPDSLTHEYRTAAGRSVRDGGGIAPEITLNYPDISRVTYNVVRDNWAFDFANRYRNTHDTLPAPEEFTITDDIFEEFKSGIDSTRFEYDKVCLGIIDGLRQAAKIEGFANDSINAQISRLEAMMHRPLAHDLDANRESITPYLEREIAERYYFTRGNIASFLRHDIAIDSAAAIIDNPSRYKALLAPDQTQKK